MKVIKAIIALVIAIFIAALIFSFETKALKSINNSVSNSAVGGPSPVSSQPK